MPKTKIPVVMSRLYEGVFVCMKCNAKMRAHPLRVAAGRVKCRKCYYHGLRPKSKERKV